jgi:hypothetical protein
LLKNELTPLELAERACMWSVFPEPSNALPSC